MTRVEDAVLAAELGVDAIGLVFTARSRRRVTIERAQAIVAALPPFVSTVALFMDDDPALVRQVADQVRPGWLQFHGNESQAWCRQFDRPFLKAIAMADPAAGLARLHDYPAAAGLLLDGHGQGEAGGSGKAFDWSVLRERMTQPVILAGGLHAGNVAAAVRSVRPWAVDVASGVESSKGIKDADKIAAFMQKVKQTDVQLSR
jgi:phosphoribosylanthranilate isomerase